METLIYLFIYVYNMAYKEKLKEEQDKGVINTDDKNKAKELSDQGYDVNLTNEAPDNMYYIKVKKDDVNILDNILTTFLDLKVQYNDDKEGTFFYFTKDSWKQYEKLALQYIEDQRLTDDILDTNIPSLGGDTLEEESQLKFSRDELIAIAREVGKAVAKAAIEFGGEINSAKIKDIYTSALSPTTPQLFTVHVIYKNDNEESYRFDIRGDSVYLIDQSYDREIADVGVKPSGEAVVNKDIVKNEMLKYFKSLNEMLPHKNIKPGSPEDHENQAYKRLTADEREKLKKIMKMIGKNEGKPMGFGTGQGRSKTISKGRETRPDLKAKLAADEPHKGKYIMHKGVPHKFKDGKLTPLKKVAEDALGFSDIEKLGSKAASDIDISVRRDPNYTFGKRPGDDDRLRYKYAKQLGYLKEEQPTVFDDESMDDLLQIILKYVKDPKDAEKELDMVDYGGLDAMSPELTAQLDRDPEFEAWYNKLHSSPSADTDYMQRRREEDDYYDADQAQKDDEEEYERGYDDDGLPLGEADTSEIDVYGYQTKHFDICPGATKLFKDIMAGEYTDGVPSVKEQVKLAGLAKLHDVLFKIEKVALKDSDKAKKHLQKAINIASDIYELGAEIGLDANHRGEDLYYIEDHIKKINDAARGELDEVRGTSYFLKTYIQPAIDELVSDGDIDESEAVIELLEHIADSYGVEIQIGGAVKEIVTEESELDKVLVNIKRALEVYKKVKDGSDPDKKKDVVDLLKKLNIKKKELLDKEDDRVSNIGKGQELDVDEDADLYEAEAKPIPDMIRKGYNQNIKNAQTMASALISVFNQFNEKESNDFSQHSGLSQVLNKLRAISKEEPTDNEKEQA